MSFYLLIGCSTSTRWNLTTLQSRFVCRVILSVCQASTDRRLCMRRQGVQIEASTSTLLEYQGRHHNMKPAPAPVVPGNTEAERFDNAVRKMFTVSKEDYLK